METNDPNNSNLKCYIVDHGVYGCLVIFASDLNEAAKFKQDYESTHTCNYAALQEIPINKGIALINYEDS